VNDDDQTRGGEPLDAQAAASDARAVGVVLVSHGRSALDLLDAARQIIVASGGGALEQVAAVTTELTENAALLQERIQQAVAQVDRGVGVLLICDLCGSTPSNVCMGIQHAMRADLDILYGLSLPMLAKLATADRGHGPTVLGREIQDSARKNIRLSSELLAGRTSKVP
jgi:PTS system mannose-specific IIA component